MSTPKFKIGDRVMLVSPDYSDLDEGFVRGQLGTVDSYSFVPYVRLDDGRRRAFNQDQLLLVRAEPARIATPAEMASVHRNVLPTDAAARNAMPMADGLLYYFPNALAAVSALSKVANEQHNPGEPMHWARNKSTDHANKIMKHLLDAGGTDSDGQRHSAKVAWRALALLEDELIAAGAVPGRNAIGSPKVMPKEHRSSVAAMAWAAYREHGA
jgi:hypothetical protein